MLTEQQLDQFIDEFWEDIPNERAEDGPAEDLEEYTLPSDGMIIRQMEKKGKVSRRTWFALSIIGFLAGILYQKGILKARKRDLCIYGFLSVVLIYGGIMNPASILMSYGYITPASLVAFYISGIPVDLVHALSTVIFLWFLSRPLLEKLERIKKKYGLIESGKEEML